MSELLRHYSPCHHRSPRRMLNKLNTSKALSKDLVAKAFYRPPSLTDSSSQVLSDKFSASHSTVQTAPTVLVKQFSESQTSISIGNGLSSPIRRVTNSPRRSPRRTISASATKRSKPRYSKSKRLCDSCPDLEYMRITSPVPPSSPPQKTPAGEECAPENDVALGKETMEKIDSYKEFFQQCRPSRRKVKFEAVNKENVPSFDSTHIQRLSVDDLQLPPGQACSKLSRNKQYEIIRELERDIRSSTSQLDRWEEMIAYEAEIAQELEHINQTLRRQVITFPSSLPPKKYLKEQIKEAERTLRKKNMQGRNVQWRK